MTTKQIENDKMFNDFISRSTIASLKNPSGRRRYIELVYRPTCDLKCKYCYLNKHGDKLFEGIDINNKEMLKNTAMILDWYIENEFKASLDIFTGEFFATDFCFDVLDLIYDKIKDIDKSKSSISSVVIPTNMTFIENDDRALRIEQYIQKFRNDLGIYIVLSASIDGKYMEENRPYTNDKNTRDDAYYDKVFTYAKKNRIGFHPMVSAYKIENWKDNYKWFFDNINKGKTKIETIQFPMMLEVRDDNWDINAITELISFMNYQIDFEYNLFKEHGRLDLYLKKTFDHSTGHYENTGLYLHSPGTDSISCAIYNAFVIRVPDLSIMPCHRTMYNPFIYGKMNVEDGKITDFTSQNLELCLTIESMNFSNMPLCSNCGIKSICAKGCLGSQMEYSGDLFTPNNSVCNMFKAKYAFLFKKFNQLGILDMLYKSDVIPKPAIEAYKQLERTILGGTNE